MLMRIAVPSSVLACLLIVAACAPGTSLSSGVPRGGPTLSDACAQAYRAYLRERRPEFFAADATGRYCAYAYCPQGRCETAFPGDAIRPCEGISGGAECYVYADGPTQSWRGPAPIADAPPLEVQGSVPVVRLRRQTHSIRDDD